MEITKGKRQEFINNNCDLIKKLSEELFNEKNKDNDYFIKSLQNNIIEAQIRILSLIKIN